MLGSGLLSGPLMGGLQSDKQELRAQIDTLHQQQNALGERLSNANDFDAAMAPRIVRDALQGKSAVVFRTPTPPTKTSTRWRGSSARPAEPSPERSR
ncbi:hypothetical protein MNVM_00100 [Mycobacterium novum]|uniref:Uncharacterized protein n=1 Tax=Mycobacterium novum TaxID=2492438 RepID=A0A7I7JHX7_9MYCO|nr:hypothetical protein MNVM_00100 [Mycobacterium novum]